MINDPEVTKLLQRANSSDLDELIENFPEDERDGRSDLQILANELSWLLYCYAEDGHALHDELKEARAWLRRTQNGKRFPGLVTSKELTHLKAKTNMAREAVNEHRRLKSLMDRLNKRGIYGDHC